MTDFSIEKSIDGPVIGLDEVGRGPLAGPVVSCGCYFSNYDDLESEIPITGPSIVFSIEKSATIFHLVLAWFQQNCRVYA